MNLRLRSEPLFFLACALILGWLGWGTLRGSDDTPLRGRSRRAEPTFESFAPPDVARALADQKFHPPLTRELFAPPRDTRPLPPLELVEPPRRPLPDLVPPTDPGPAPRAWGRVLRRPLELPEVADLFDPLEGVGEDGDAFLELAPEEEGPRSLIRSAADEAEPPDPFADETPDERARRLAGYRRLYDWVQRRGEGPWFGRIENPDRLGLLFDPDRSQEPLRFLRLNPVTGREWFENIRAAAQEIPRDDVEDFGFAETPSNELEIRRRALGDTLTRGSWKEALALADECVRRRHEAPRALAIAEELYRRAIAFDPKDPEPRLGLAATFEAGFRFEEAFAEYQGLLEEFSHRPEVHVRLARLEERFLLFDEAEARLRQALSLDRASWVARFGLGSFLARRGRWEQAVPHLVEANRNAPQDPARLHERVAIRSLLGDARFALGELEGARRLYEQALAADPDHERSRAGLVALRAYLGDEGPTDGSGLEARAGNGAENAGFERLLARGVASILDPQRPDPVQAREFLELARDADPLRSDRALAALAYLAWKSGHPDLAIGLAEEASEREPGNAYALYLLGRLRGRQDDYAGARQALLAALDVELDFEDALVALGETAFELGRFEDARRYLERALRLSPERPEVHALLGLDLLRLGNVADARTSFERALELDPDAPTAACGLAWCTYLAGDWQEAVVQLGALDDRRRREPQDDPWRVWARDQIERIQDHREKVEWTDSFDRTRLLNDWFTREGDGPVVSMEEGAVKIEGVFRTSGATRVYREYPAGLFVSLAADVWIEPGKDSVRAGLFVARERRRRSESEIVAEASVFRHPEGNLQVRFLRSAQDAKVVDMQESFPVGRWVRLRIDRQGEGSETTLDIYVDGVPLVLAERFPSLGRTTTPLLVGLFAEGERAREVEVKMDNCSVVWRARR